MKPLTLALFIGTLCSTVTLAACGNQSGDSAPATVDAEPAVAVDAALPGGDMTAEEAVKIIKDLAERGALKTTVQKRYEERVQDKVACTPYDIERDKSAYPNNPELWRCKAVGGGPYTKDVQRWVDKCCKAKSVTVPPNVALHAEYSNADEKWHVIGDYSVEGEQHHSTWTVDKLTKEVGEAE